MTVVCRAGESSSNSNSLPCRGAIGIGFLGSRGRSNLTAAGEGYALSEVLGGMPVTVICEGTPRVCFLLSPVARNHPVVRALLETWCRFFSCYPRGRYLQVYTGSSGAFIELAYRLFQRCYPCLARRIRVVGIGPSTFVPSAENAHYYRVTCDFFTYASFVSYYGERVRGRITTVRYSPDLTSLVPAGLDPSYNLPLRAELSRLAGFSPLSSVCVSFRQEGLGRHEFIYVCTIDPEHDDVGERSRVFQWIAGFLNSPRTGTEEWDNYAPTNFHERICRCLEALGGVVTFVSMVGHRGILNAGLNEAPIIFCASCFMASGVGSIILWVTNGTTRRRRWRCARILSRFFSDLARVSVGIVVVESTRFNFMNFRQYLAGERVTTCQLFNGMWSMILLTELFALDLLSQYGGSLYGAAQRLFIRCASPHLYRQIMNTVSGRGGDEEQGGGSSSSSSASSENESNRCLVSRTGTAQIITEQENTAIRISTFVLRLLFGAALLCITTLGMDLSNLALLPSCRQNCNNSSNCTTDPIYPYSRENYTFSNFTGALEDGTVHTTALTVRSVFQVVFFFYYLFVAAQMIMGSRRSNRR